MPPAIAAALEAAEPFQRALAEERLRNAQNLVRVLGLSGFLALSVLLRVTGVYDVMPSFGLFAGYWALALLVLWASRRSARVARLGGLPMGVAISPPPFLSGLTVRLLFARRST